jgi:hypothetical protein
MKLCFCRDGSIVVSSASLVKLWRGSILANNWEMRYTWNDLVVLRGRDGDSGAKDANPSTSRERRPVMIQTLRYEPFGQRQRFEAPQQEQDRHIHLHINLNFTFRAPQKRSIPTPHAIRITRIFAALVGATVIPLALFGVGTQEGIPPTLSVIAGIFLVGLAIAWGFGCFPLLDSAWRSTPRVGFLLLVRNIQLILFPGLLVFPIMYLLEVLRIHPDPLGTLIVLLFYVHPLISAILLACVSRETRALRQTATAHRKLGFIIMSGMALMLLGGLLLNLLLMLSSGPPLQLLLFLPGMCGAVIIAIYTLLELFRQQMSTQARPKNSSPSDVDSFQEP